jgi:hypothetical protein
MRYRCALSAVVLAAALVSGCSKKPDDAALATDIKSQMFSDAALKDSSLQVTSNGGVVTLAGSVGNEAARYEAYKIATQTPGVSKVNDQMTVQSAQNTAPIPAATSPDAAQAAPPVPAASPATRADDAAAKRKERREREREKKQAVMADNFVPPAPQQQDNYPPADQVPPPPAMPAANPAPAPPSTPPPPPPPQPKTYTVAPGSTITIRMIDSVDSSVNKPGEIFHASLDAPIVVDDQVVVPRGADVYVRLSDASSAGKFTGKSELHMELIKLEFQGRSYPLVSTTYSLTGSSRGKNTAEKVGGGAALGAIIGAIAGGGKGAAIGAGVGAGAGGVYQGATKGKQVKIPSETKLDFQLDQPATISVMPRSSPASQ